jgi:hypothetical protein
MRCDPFIDLIELYAIGALETADAEAFRYHLESGCQQCRERLDEAITQAALISSTIPLEEPPAGLRNRIAASVNLKPVIAMPPKKRVITYAPWLIAAAALITMIVGIDHQANLRRQEVSSLSASLDTAKSQAVTEAQRTAQMLNILQAPGTTEVELHVNKPDQPEGNLFIHAKLGVAMIIANLPDPPPGWKYESWVLPKAGEPEPIESFSKNQAGIAFTIVKGPVDIAQWSAVAVSLEPESSRPVKPTKTVFVNPV